MIDVDDTVPPEHAPRDRRSRPPVDVDLAEVLAGVDGVRGEARRAEQRGLGEGRGPSVRGRRRGGAPIPPPRLHEKGEHRRAPRVREARARRVVERVAPRRRPRAGQLGEVDVAGEKERPARARRGEEGEEARAGLRERGPRLGDKGVAGGDHLDEGRGRCAPQTHV